jgi:hypothetical protein
MIYEDARRQADREGHRELSEQYGSALAALGRGEEAQDVRSGQRAVSSRATTRPRDILMKRPFRTPPPPRRQTTPAAPPRDDWEDDDGQGAPVTRPRAR